MQTIQPLLYTPYFPTIHRLLSGPRQILKTSIASSSSGKDILGLFSGMKACCEDREMVSESYDDEFANGEYKAAQRKCSTHKGVDAEARLALTTDTYRFSV